MKRVRARELGIVIGEMETGRYNAITDVEGVGVGHSTIIKGEGPLVPGKGPIRTGVTAITPHDRAIYTEKVRAAVYIFNAYGKSLGLDQVRQMGALETPILSTDTWNVWKVADAIFDYMFEKYDIQPTTVNPVVGETQGKFLNDSWGRYVGKREVFEALDEARSSRGKRHVEEGNVGGGTPMSGYGFKGGIGTASRRTDNFTLGVLTQLNFGRRRDLMINGVPVGNELKDYEENPDPIEEGSCMVYIAIDLGLTSRQLYKVAKRAMLGLARTGSYGGEGSGDYIIAFSTGKRDIDDLYLHNFKERKNRYPELTRAHYPKIAESWLNPVYRAVVEATEESIINAMFKAETMVGRDGNTRYSMPLDRVQEIMKKYGRL
jgi:D-aminopeptidase